MTAPVATPDALARLSAFGLPGVPDDPIELEHPAGLLAAATGMRALPWVAGAVDAGWVTGHDDAWRESLRAAHLGAVQSTMVAHAAAALVVERLTDAGITDVRVLKGCATAHLDHDRPTDRFSTDVDLLVRAGDLRRVIAAFPEVDVPVPRRARWQEEHAKSTTIVSSRGVEVDIHTRLTQGYFGMVIPPDELFADPAPFTITDVPMLALDGPNRLIHAADHVAASRVKGLHSVRDVLQLVLVSGVDWEVAAERTERWGIDALFARGVQEAWASFPVPEHPIVEWARGVVARGRQRLALQLVGDRPRGHLLTAPLALPLHRWPGYVGPLLFPSRAHLDHWGKSWTTRMRQILAELAPNRR